MSNTRTETIPFIGRSNSLRQAVSSSLRPLERLIGSSSRQQENYQLEEIIGIDRDIDIFRQNQLKLLKPKTLYESRNLFRTTGLIRSYQKQTIS